MSSIFCRILGALVLGWAPNDFLKKMIICIPVQRYIVILPTGDELLQEEMESDDVEKPKTQPTETDNLDLPHLDKHMDIDSMLSEGKNLA